MGDLNLRVLIDPASQAEIISHNAVEKMNNCIERTETKLVSAEGSELKVLGQTDLCLNIAGSDYNLKAQVVQSLSSC